MFVFRWNKKSEILGIYQRMKKEKVGLTKKGRGKDRKYILIFENKGKEIGVTLSHPHGQIYAFPYIPPIALEELRSSQKFYRKNKKCLHCEIIKKELEDKERIVIENKDFVAFIPFYARWPY